MLCFVFLVHLIHVLGWSDTSVSILEGAWGTLIVISIALLGGWLADYLGARRLLMAVVVIQVSYMLTVNLIETHWSKRPVAVAVLILRNMMDPILSTASIPLLMSLCRTHVEGDFCKLIAEDTIVFDFLLIGSQFTAYMSMLNFSELLGAFISGHLQRHFRANMIGLGCAILIMCALLMVSCGLCYERRHTPTAAVLSEKTESIDGIALKNRRPIQAFAEDHPQSLDPLSPNKTNNCENTNC